MVIEFEGIVKDRWGWGCDEKKKRVATNAHPSTSYATHILAMHDPLDTLFRFCSIPLSINFHIIEIHLRRIRFTSHTQFQSARRRYRQPEHARLEIIFVVVFGTLTYCALELVLVNRVVAAVAVVASLCQPSYHWCCSDWMDVSMSLLTLAPPSTTTQHLIHVTISTFPHQTDAMPSLLMALARAH